MNACYEHEKKAKKEFAKRTAFRLEASEDPAFLKGRQASVIVDDVAIGVVGVLHPDVLGPKGFDISMAGSALEVNIEPFLEWL